MYLYRAIDSSGETVDFWFSKHRDLPAAKRYLRKALEHNGQPDSIGIDGSPPTIRQSSYAMQRAV